MNSYVAIILGVSVLILIYIIYLVLFKSSADTVLNSPIDFMDSSGNVKGTLVDDKLIKNITSSNYAISCWVCVNNWKDTSSYNGKTVYALLNNNNPPSYTATSFSSGTPTSPYPIFPWNNIDNNFTKLYTPGATCYYALCLDSKYPNLYFTILSKKPTETTSNSYPIFITDNFPMQKWTNVIISMEGNQMDAYIDGKLIQSGPIAYLDNSGNTNLLVKDDIKLTNAPGFIIGNSKEKNVDISVTNVSIYSNPIDPQTAHSIYGYGSGVSSSRTKVNVSLSQNNNVFRDIKLI